jgi:predicted RNA-binding protein with PUA-like domain
MKYWLMKSEPDVYAWSKLVADGRGKWDGVRNHSAKLNLLAMKKGDRAFFYHSNIGKEIVGRRPERRSALPRSRRCPNLAKWRSSGSRACPSSR